MDQQVERVDTDEIESVHMETTRSTLDESGTGWSTSYPRSHPIRVICILKWCVRRRRITNCRTSRGYSWATTTSWISIDPIPTPVDALVLPNDVVASTGGTGDVVDAGAGHVL